MNHVAFVTKFTNVYITWWDNFCLFFHNMLKKGHYTVHMSVDKYDPILESFIDPSGIQITNL